MIEYPTVNFKSFVTKTYQFQNTGYLVGEWLSVGWTNNLLKSNSVFNCYGYRVAPIEFKTWVDAVQFAEFVNNSYQGYFELWHENPQADIPQLTQYTIEQGQAIVFAIKHFTGKIITFGEFVNEYTRLSS